MESHELVIEIGQEVDGDVVIVMQPSGQELPEERESL